MHTVYIQLKWSKCFECPQNTAYLKMQKSDLQKDKTARKYILKEACAMMEQGSLDRWNQNELAPTCGERSSSWSTVHHIIC